MGQCCNPLLITISNMYTEQTRSNIIITSSNQSNDKYTVTFRSLIRSNGKSGSLMFWRNWAEKRIHLVNRNLTILSLMKSGIKWILQSMVTIQRTPRWLGGVVVRALDSWSRGRGFDSDRGTIRATTLGKLFTPNVPLFIKQYNLVPCEGFHANAP